MATDELGTLKTSEREELELIMQKLLQGSMRSGELRKAVDFKKDKYGERIKTLVSLDLVKAITGKMTVAYELTEKGRKHIHFLNSPESSQVAIQIQEKEELEPIIRTFDASGWKGIEGEIILQAKETLYISTIGSSALEKEEYKKFTDVAFPELVSKGVKVRMIAADGYMKDEIFEQLKKYGVQVSFVSIDNLQEMPGRLRPSFEKIKDLCHITVSDDLHWLCTETSGNRNTRRGFQYWNDRKNARELREILHTMWRLGQPEQHHTPN